MPAKPLAPETLQLIDAVRDALAAHAPDAEVEEKTMFGCLVFMVNGKMCLGVENDELLVRLPPDTHDAVAEMPGLRPLSSKGLMQGYFLVGPTAYATREAWQHWVVQALAFNPLAKATPKNKSKNKGKSPPAAQAANGAPTPKAPARKRHSVFESDI
mgnify:CR=1 FL=1